MKKTPMRIDETQLDEKDTQEASNFMVKSITKMVEEKKHSIKSGIKKSILLFGLFFSIILVSMLYSFITNISAMFATSPIIGSLYLILVLLFIALLGYIFYGEYRDFKKIKEIDNLQKEAQELIKNPSAKTKSFFKKLSGEYLKHPDEEIANAAKRYHEEIDTLLEGEIAKRFEERVLDKLDNLAREKISKYSTQTALSTAISPVAFIDALLIISRSHMMITEIAKVYGYKPHFAGRLALYKRVFGILAFASVTDILANHSHDLLGNSFLSKLSAHSAQGVANGILVARVGLSTIKACRPIKYKKSGEGFLKNITATITKKLFGRA